MGKTSIALVLALLVVATGLAQTIPAPASIGQATNMVSQDVYMSPARMADFWNDIGIPYVLANGGGGGPTNGLTLSQAQQLMITNPVNFSTVGSNSLSISNIQLCGELILTNSEVPSWFRIYSDLDFSGYTNWFLFDGTSVAVFGADGSMYFGNINSMFVSIGNGRGGDAASNITNQSGILIDSDFQESGPSIYLSAPDGLADNSMDIVITTTNNVLPTGRVLLNGVPLAISTGTYSNMTVGNATTARTATTSLGTNNFSTNVFASLNTNIFYLYGPTTTNNAGDPNVGNTNGVTWQWSTADGFYTNGVPSYFAYFTNSSPIQGPYAGLPALLIGSTTNSLVGYFTNFEYSISAYYNENTGAFGEDCSVFDASGNPRSSSPLKPAPYSYVMAVTGSGFYSFANYQQSIISTNTFGNVLNQTNSLTGVINLVSSRQGFYSPNQIDIGVGDTIENDFGAGVPPFVLPQHFPGPSVIAGFYNQNYGTKSVILAANGCINWETGCFMGGCADEVMYLGQGDEAVLASEGGVYQNVGNGCGGKFGTFECTNFGVGQNVQIASEYSLMDVNTRNFLRGSGIHNYDNVNNGFAVGSYQTNGVPGVAGDLGISSIFDIGDGNIVTNPHTIFLGFTNKGLTITTNGVLTGNGGGLTNYQATNLVGVLVTNNLPMAQLGGGNLTSICFTNDFYAYTNGNLITNSCPWVPSMVISSLLCVTNDYTSMYQAGDMISLHDVNEACMGQTFSNPDLEGDNPSMQFTVTISGTNVLLINSQAAGFQAAYYLPYFSSDLGSALSAQNAQDNPENFSEVNQCFK